MKIKLPIEFEIPIEDQKKIVEEYLRYFLPYDSEIKEVGGKRCWFQKTYDARGDKVIKLENIGPVREVDEAILKVLENL
jgi:hypothetical protein